MENYNATEGKGQQEIIDIILERLKSEFPDSKFSDILDKQDLHEELFNRDYFIIGTFEAKNWLQENIGILEAIEIVREYEEFNFGEFNTEIQAEKILNMFAYIIGDEIIQKIDEEDTIKEVIRKIEEL